MTTIAFGDSVRIRSTAETEQLGLAGRTGFVQGWTTPSVTSVPVVGIDAKDRAVSAKVEGQSDPLWLDPDLVEFVDHSAGLRVKVGDRSCTRGASGEWVDDAPAADGQPES